MAGVGTRGRGYLATTTAPEEMPEISCGVSLLSKGTEGHFPILNAYCGRPDRHSSVSLDPKVGRRLS